MSKRVLVYGDSNSWGYIPLSGERFGENERWPSIMQSILGEEYRVLEENLSGRTTTFDDPLRDFRNGARQIEHTLTVHYPIDLLIVCLGTNDLKRVFNATPLIVKKGLAYLFEIIERSFLIKEVKPKYLVASPPELGDNIAETVSAQIFGDSAFQYSKEFKHYFNEFSKEKGYYFFDCSLYAKVSKKDAIHLEAEGHKKIAEAMSEKVRGILA